MLEINVLYKFRNLVTSHRYMTNPIFCKVKQLNSQKRTIHEIIWCKTYILDINQANTSKNRRNCSKSSKNKQNQGFCNIAYL